jgi:NADH-quinone oxidoreductase subunit J
MSTAVVCRNPRRHMPRIVHVILLAIVALFTAFGSGATVAAQPIAPNGAPAISSRVQTYPQGDRVQGRTPDSKGMALLFWLFAGITVGGALFVITRKNLIAAVMGMVGTFLGVACVYMMLYAHFLSVVQMLVYAGAIMVLFVFVIMILNKPEDEPVAKGNNIGKALGGIAIGYLVLRLATLLISVEPASKELSAMAPTPVKISDVTGLKGTPEFADWGGTKAVGFELFTEGLFPFEAISILLLIAVVGAVAIARPLKDDESSAAGV